MSIAIRYAVFSAAFLVSSVALSAPPQELRPENSFRSFEVESKKISSSLGCSRSRVNRATGDLGALYSCIGGKAETVKFFINELPNSGGRVKNAKLVWNDYTKNAGHGVHADAAIAKQWVRQLAALYAPAQKSKVAKLFHGKQNAVVESTTHKLIYTYEKGPIIDERMFVVTRR